MTREEKILYGINKSQIGIEIGPSHNPIASKANGYKVDIIDHLSRSQLIEKYKSHNVDLSKIEDVDFIWSGESYSQLTGHKKFYSWIIASHVIEHTPDMISFLNQCDDVLKEDGILSLAIPDVRYCFDFFRPITGISKILDAYFNKNLIHSAGTAAEYFLNFVKRGGNISWFEGFNEELTFEFTPQNAFDQMQTILETGAYVDLHAWCFTPTSFRLLIHDLNSLGLLALKESSFFPSEGCEFFITLSRNGQGFNDDRMTALKQIKRELSFSDL